MRCARSSDGEHFTVDAHAAIWPSTDLEEYGCEDVRANDGGHTALMRPMPSSFDHVLGIWLAYPDRDLPWGGRKPLILPRGGYWDERHTGAGTVPIRCKEGWLVIYHGADANLRYCMGAALLDGEDPSRVLARSPEPILEPEADYELSGLFSNVVYCSGHVAL